MTMSAATLAYSQRGVSARAGYHYSAFLVYNVLDVGAGEDPTQADDLPYLGQKDTVLGYEAVCINLSSRLHPELESAAQVTVEWVEDPLSMPPEVSYFTSHKQVAAWLATRALLGIPTDEARSFMGTDGEWNGYGTRLKTEIVPRNSAGDLYNPPLSMDKPLIRLEVVRRRSCEEWYADTILYTKKTNLNPFAIEYLDGNGDVCWDGEFDPGTVLLSDIRAPMIREPYYHRMVTYCFEIDPETWLKKVPNMGPRVVKPGGSDSGTSKLELPLDDAGTKFHGSVPLRPGGEQVSAADLMGGKTYDNIFEIYDRIDFDELGTTTASGYKGVFDWEPDPDTFPAPG